jgi:hypothetical protein
VALGSGAGQNLTTGSNNVAIASPGAAGESATIRIGTNAKQTAAFIAGISGASVPGNARQVLISPNGKLGTAPVRSGAKPLAATVTRLSAELRRQQRQLERLRERVKGAD